MIFLLGDVWVAGAERIPRARRRQVLYVVYARLLHRAIYPTLFFCPRIIYKNTSVDKSLPHVAVRLNTHAGMCCIDAIGRGVCSLWSVRCQEPLDATKSKCTTDHRSRGVHFIMSLITTGLPQRKPQSARVSLTIAVLRNTIKGTSCMLK